MVIIVLKIIIKKIKSDGPVINEIFIKFKFFNIKICLFIHPITKIDNIKKKKSLKKMG